ncbi:hypothetical protein B0H15DRAFT_581807 [Mycena belliarum]|uniref:Uncharacterized protein n=1 Tax=Mycena belliarum TaxID=1033014 RepID=A0AAD6UC09_9AGAR|nr:hypothetical protein B0H15DRAFT_581807 [Mycena belliae]
MPIVVVERGDVRCDDMSLLSSTRWQRCRPLRPQAKLKLKASRARARRVAAAADSDLLGPPPSPACNVITSTSTPQTHDLAAPFALPLSLQPAHDFYHPVHPSLPRTSTALPVAVPRSRRRPFQGTALRPPCAVGSPRLGLPPAWTSSSTYEPRTSLRQRLRCLLRLRGSPRPPLPPQRSRRTAVERPGNLHYAVQHPTLPPQPCALAIVVRHRERPASPAHGVACSIRAAQRGVRTYQAESACVGVVSCRTHAGASRNVAEHGRAFSLQAASEPATPPSPLRCPPDARDTRGRSPARRPTAQSLARRGTRRRHAEQRASQSPCSRRASSRAPGSRAGSPDARSPQTRR